MDLILYSCKARLHSYFRQKKIQRVLLLALGIVLSGFYAWLFSYLLQQAQEGSLNMSVDQMLGYTNLLLLAFTILRGFFPAYIPKADFINRIYPVKPLMRFWTELVVELVSPFYFVLLNFLLLLSIISPDYTFLHLVQSFLVFLTAHITRRSFQIFVERRINWRSSVFWAAVVMAGAFIALEARAPMFEPISTVIMLVVHLASLGFFLTSNYFLEQAAFEPKRRTVNYSSNARRSLGWRLFKNHKMAKQLLLFGLGFKVLMLGIDATVYSIKGIHMLDKNASLWLFVGPLVIYTYVFNNVWGFYKNLWLTTERATGNYKEFLKASLLPLRMPLLIDAAIVVLYVALFNHEQATFILLMYSAAVLVLTPIGIIASFTSPKMVKGGILSFSAKTSYLYSFISILLLGLLFLPLLHPLLYLAYPVVIALTLFAMVAVLREYKQYKYKLFETLYKTE
ncbi:hypothetical protein H9Q13_08155 [Pontibacter sp. JH31]|uniref:Membrane protein involved in the export of O-antigen and teichoic acid n=1 Tax=Pontibacter aquaedesilientis TaxID=2766980 RepID=A0ABR7XFR4_9BACT|nr:hypothetical protein [Pontibacter aquaedesilientis]MBD1397133.1 hypothetical protein [Pontibacter aquaedesilientis]